MGNRAGGATQSSPGKRSSRWCCPWCGTTAELYGSSGPYCRTTRECHRDNSRVLPDHARALSGQPAGSIGTTRGFYRDYPRVLSGLPAGSIGTTRGFYRDDSRAPTGRLAGANGMTRGFEREDSRVLTGGLTGSSGSTHASYREDRVVVPHHSSVVPVRPATGAWSTRSCSEEQTRVVPQHSSVDPSGDTGSAAGLAGDPDTTGLSCRSARGSSRYGD
jgi:hypothetical protein